MKQAIPTLHPITDQATEVASDPSRTTDHKLLQELLSHSRSSVEKPQANLSNSVHQRFMGWETAKSQLTEIQKLLIEAYEDLELMEVNTID